MEKYIKTAETNLPIEIDDVASWLRLNNTEEGFILDVLLESAFYKLEDKTDKMFTSRQVEYYTDNLLTGNHSNYEYLELNVAPITTISGVYAYYNGEYTVMDTGDYDAQIGEHYTRIYFTDGISYDDPSVFPFKVIVTAGYETTPADFKLALLHYIAFLYENRGDVVAEGNLAWPKELDTFINKYRRLTVI